jgi:hypothetical protein
MAKQRVFEYCVIHHPPRRKKDEEDGVRRQSKWHGIGPTSRPLNGRRAPT